MDTLLRAKLLFLIGFNMRVIRHIILNRIALVSTSAATPTYPAQPDWKQTCDSEAQFQNFTLNSEPNNILVHAARDYSSGKLFNISL